MFAIIIVQGAPEENNKKLKRKEKAAVTKYKQPGKRLWKI